MGSAPSFAFTARSPNDTYGAVRDGQDYDDEEYEDEDGILESEEEGYGEYEEENTFEGSHQGDGSAVMRDSSGFFYADPVSPSGEAGHAHGPSGQPRIKQGRQARRSFGLGHFNFTPTPERPPHQYDESTPGTASLATSPTSHIFHDPSRRHLESTPLLSADTGASVSTPQRLTIEEAELPASEASQSRRHSILERRRVSAMSGRRMSVSKRSIRSRRSIVVERGESTDGQTVRPVLAYLSVKCSRGAAVQRCRCTGRDWHPVITAGATLHGLDIGYRRPDWFRRFDVPYVSTRRRHPVQADRKGEALGQAHRLGSRYEGLYGSRQKGIWTLGGRSDYTAVRPWGLAEWAVKADGNEVSAWNYLLTGTLMRFSGSLG